MSWGQVTRTCKVCQQQFNTYRSEVKRGGGNYCSKGCYKRRVKPLAERFWSKVNKDGPIQPHVPELGPCWVWTGAKYGSKWKYGFLGGCRGARNKLAHHLSWEMHCGPIPEGQWVLHRCDNPPCVNPKHLFLGTAKDNTQDMLKKGRHKHSGRKPGSKLSPESLASFRKKRGYT